MPWEKTPVIAVHATSRVANTSVIRFISGLLFARDAASVFPSDCEQERASFKGVVKEPLIVVEIL